MSYYEARLLRFNPEDEDYEDEGEGMSGSTIALIAVGILAAAGGGYWWYSRSKAQEAATAEASDTADTAVAPTSAVPPSPDVSAKNEQAKAALVQGGKRQAEADAAYPVVTYLNGTKATLTRDEVVALVSAGKLSWTNALRTTASEVSPDAPKSSSGGLKFGGKPKGKPKKKKGKK